LTDLTTKIILFETGELNGYDTIKLFSELVKSGLAWSLQGSYGRSAQGLIEAGVLDNKGEILKTEEQLEEEYLN